MPVHIEQVLAKLAHWNAEAQRLHKQLTEAEEQANRFRNYVDVHREIEEAGSKQEPDVPASTTVSVSDTADGRTLTRRVTDMAVDLIRAKGRPIRTRDLLVQMEQQGLIVGGQNRVTNLSGILTRDKKRLVVNRKLVGDWRDGVAIHHPLPDDLPR